MTIVHRSFVLCQIWQRLRVHKFSVLAALACLELASINLGAPILYLYKKKATSRSQNELEPFWKFQPNKPIDMLDCEWCHTAVKYLLWCSAPPNVLDGLPKQVSPTNPPHPLQFPSYMHRLTSLRQFTHYGGNGWPHKLCCLHFLSS